MGKKIKMKVRGARSFGSVSVHVDDMINGLVPVETKGVAHKVVKFQRGRMTGHDGFTADPGRTASRRGTRKAK